MFSYPGPSQALPYPSGQHHVMPVPVSLQGTAPPTGNQPSSPSNKHISGTFYCINLKEESQATLLQVVPCPFILLKNNTSICL